MTRPQRQKKYDRLTHHGASAVEIQCDMATGPFDTACRAMDQKWGVDRLPDLVSVETAAKWGVAMANLNAAIASQDPAMVAARVQACLRGFSAMDAEATAAGHKPITPDAWEVHVSGKLCAILRDDAAWPAYAALRPDVRVYSLQAVVAALAAYDNGIAPVAAAFPGAKVSAIRPRTELERDLNDEIPF